VIPCFTRKSFNSVYFFLFAIICIYCTYENCYAFFFICSYCSMFAGLLQLRNHSVCRSEFSDSSPCFSFTAPLPNTLVYSSGLSLCLSGKLPSQCNHLPEGTQTIVVQYSTQCRHIPSRSCPFGVAIRHTALLWLLL
jgi:hypothetical protein